MQVMLVQGVPCSVTRLISDVNLHSICVFLMTCMQLNPALHVYAGLCNWGCVVWGG